MSDVPDKIRCEAETVAASLLPVKSGDKYLQTYEQFMNWKKAENIDQNNFSETVLLAYFGHLNSKYKPTTLWVIYSMLRTTIEQKNNVDIKYQKLILFLKKEAVGYVPKKASVFKGDEINRFLCKADDNEFLAAKVILIFGIYGASRAEELTKVCMKHIKEEGNVFIVKFPKTKTNIVRSFTIEKEYGDYVRRYMKLRPRNVQTDRFFLNFQKGKCTAQPIGRNKFLGSPKMIATFLNLEDPEKYTGHSYRRTSATLLADAGGDMTMLKRLGGWKSATTVEGYLEDSVQNKRKISDLISNRIGLASSVSNTDSKDDDFSMMLDDFVDNENDRSTVINEESKDAVNSNAREVGVATSATAIHSVSQVRTSSTYESRHTNNFHNCTVQITYK